MITKFFSNQTPKTRIAVGLVSILICVSIGASFLGLFPDRYGAVLAGRAAIAETVAVNSSVFITRSDVRRMEANLQILISRNEEMLSAAVKSKEGKTVAEIGEHESEWQPLEEGFSTESQLVVPIFEGENQWGHIELRFKPIKNTGPFAFFYEPLTQYIMFVACFCFFFFKFYLGKMLKQLDPSQAIPDRVRSALDTMAEGLLVLDAKKNIVLANEAFAELVGRKPNKLLGVNIKTFPWQRVETDSGDAKLLGAEPKDYPWNMALASSSMQTNHMLRLQIDGGKSYTFMVNCSPVLGQSGKAAGVMVSFDDITELEEKEIELRRSKEEAEAANRAKSDFLANMSHEIRTPMNAILGFTEVLMRGYSKTDSQKYLATISSSGKHLLDLINDILDLSKVEAGRVEIEILPSPAHRVLQEVVKIMGIKAREKGIAIDFKALDNMPDMVLTDPGRLRQIVTNLVGNAIKFTEQGGVTVTMKYQANSQPPKLVVDVTDTGIGMSPEQAAAVFNPFVQADSSITRRFGGTGLGLTISKRFAEAMGGDITVTSETGRGSTFSIVIDAQAADNATILSPAELVSDDILTDQQEQERWSLPAANVLVVDDGDENRDLLTVVLGDAGLTITEAANGQEALDALDQGSFDLILMDVQMPVMDGYTAAGIMRERGVSIPIIALTAHAMKGAEQQCLDAGYSGFMTKPIDIDLLLEKLATELGGKKVRVTEALPVSRQENTQTSTATTSSEIAKEDDASVPTLVMKPDQVKPIKQGEQEKESVHLPVRSSLINTSPKFKSLVERFVKRLSEQFVKIEEAASNEDYEQLANLAHWLKGSAGSVGFHDFTEPAEALETFAKANDVTGVSQKLHEIKMLIAHIDVNSGETAAAKPAAARDATSNEDTDADRTATITSSLVEKSPKLRPMAEKFIVRLAEKNQLMNTALVQGDYNELADLAHWLKGSAGTIGFHAFTEPAIELENAAKAADPVAAEKWLKYICALEKNIVLPEPASQSGS